MPLFCPCLAVFCCNLYGGFRSDVSITIWRKGSSKGLVLRLDVLHWPEAIFVYVLLYAYFFLDADRLLGGFGVLSSFQRLIANIELPVFWVPFLQFDFRDVIMILLATVEFDFALMTYLKRFCIGVTRYLLFLYLLFALFAFFWGEYAQIQLNSFLLEGCILEHREEIGPLWVYDGVIDVLPEDCLVEPVEVLRHLLNHNDIIRI